MKKVFPEHEQKMNELFSSISSDELQKMNEHLKTIGLAAKNS